MSAETIRFLIQAGFAVVAVLMVIFVDAPYGPTLGLFCVVFGLWLGRRIFKRIATPDEVRADLRARADEGP